jgi:hypothetical protein
MSTEYHTTNTGSMPKQEKENQRLFVITQFSLVLCS